MILRQDFTRLSHQAFTLHGKDDFDSWRQDELLTIL